MPFCNPSLITIPSDRFRDADKEEVKLMADSIKQIGQLQPIVVDKDMNLTVGRHRLEACRILNRDVWYDTEENARLILDNPLMRRIAEYQENFRRRNFTQDESNKAIAEIDRLMREVHGSKSTGPSGGDGWTQADTAKKLGFKSVSSVSEAIKVSKAIDAGIPGVADAKTTKEALTIVKKLTRLEAAGELAKRRAAAGSTGEIEDPFKYFGDKLILGDCLEKMKELPSNICNFFITDPPFGIELDQLIASRRESTDKSLGVYSDNETDILSLTKGVISEIARVGKDTCAVVMFCGVQFWHILKTHFEDIGFKVHIKPLIWVKANTDPFRLTTGRTMNPAFSPGSSYEAMIYARRGDVVLAKQGLSDVFVHQTVHGDSKCHIAQKPIPLMEEIIARFYHPATNPLLIDPFAGSGSTLIAAHRIGLKLFFGYELDPQNRERALIYMVNEYMKEQDGRSASTTTLEIDLDLDDEDI